MNQVVKDREARHEYEEDGDESVNIVRLGAHKLNIGFIIITEGAVCFALEGARGVIVKGILLVLCADKV